LIRKRKKQIKKFEQHFCFLNIESHLSKILFVKKAVVLQPTHFSNFYSPHISHNFNYLDCMEMVRWFRGCSWIEKSAYCKWVSLFYICTLILICGRLCVGNSTCSVECEEKGWHNHHKTPAINFNWLEGMAILMHLFDWRVSAVPRTKNSVQKELLICSCIAM
jgi:hypothetical protein